MFADVLLFGTLPNHGESTTEHLRAARISYIHYNAILPTSVVIVAYGQPPCLPPRRRANAAGIHSPRSDLSKADTTALESRNAQNSRHKTLSDNMTAACSLRTLIYSTTSHAILLAITYSKEIPPKKPPRHPTHIQHHKKHADHDLIVRRLEEYILAYKSGKPEAMMEFYHPTNFIYSDFSSYLQTHQYSLTHHTYTNSPHKVHLAHK